MSHELRIRTATGHTVILRVARGAGRYAAREIARMVLYRTHGITLTDAWRLMEQLKQKEPAA